MESLSHTENGAISLGSTKDPRLNLFFKTTRDMGKLPINIDKEINNENDINSMNKKLYKMIDESWNVSPIDTMKILFNWRDCRGGKGDYTGFISSMIHISNKNPKWLIENIDNIPEYGSWLDLVKLWHFVSDEIKESIMIYMLRTIHDDIINNEKISLLAKWLPSENSKWDIVNGKSFVIELCKVIFNKENSIITTRDIKKFRKEILVPLRKKLNIIETPLCEREYDKIKYEHVPSLAMKKYRKAFKNNDTVRFEDYLSQVSNGEKKINSSQVYPHDLVREYLKYDSEPNQVIEEQWKSIKERVNGSGVFNNSIVVCDVSSSMTGTPMDVSIALGLLGLFENKVITFSEYPQLHFVPDGSLYSQVQNIKRMHWGGSTDFEKVMDLVLGLSYRNENNKIKRIFVFSDMQFNIAFSNSNNTHFEILKSKFIERGLEMPQIIFWNLRGDTEDFPVSCDENGVTLMSGYSPSLLNNLLDNKEITPMAFLMNLINSPRYNKIKIP